MRDHRKEDRMESFFLAETTKYLYLLFDTDNFIHNQGQQGTLINTINGKCVIETGGYIFNTEAHPIDLAALHCCHDVPKTQLFDFTNLNSKKSLFKGETLNEISSERKQNNNYEEDTITDGVEYSENVNNTSNVAACAAGDNVLENLGTNESYIMPSNYEKSVPSNVTENVKTDTSVNGTNSFIRHILGDHTKQVDPQQMLERIREKRKYLKCSISEDNYKLLSCKSQSFMQKISILGEFFNT